MDGITQFLYVFIQVISALMAVVLGGGAMWLVFAYGRSIVEARTIRVSTVIFGAIILIAVGIGLRDYPAFLMRSATEGFNKLALESPAFRESINGFALQVVDEMGSVSESPSSITVDGTPATHPAADGSSGGGVPVTETGDVFVFPTAGVAPEETPVEVNPTLTETPNPLLTPMPTLVNSQLNATPTLAPTATYTAVPTIDPTTWNPKTPAPTPKSGG